MATPKRSFGIAHFLAEKSVVYYETVQGELQIGRIVDLLSGLQGASQATARVRAVATLLLSEACKRQADPATQSEVGDPILVECGSDSDWICFGVSFTTLERVDWKPSVDRVRASVAENESELRLLHVARFADKFSFKVHADTQRVEWVISIKKADASALKPEPTPIEFLSFEGEPEEAPKAVDYQELGDVEYKQITEVSGSKGELAPKSAVNQILEAAAPKERDVIKNTMTEEAIATKLLEGDPESAAQMLKAALKPEEITEILTKKVSKEVQAQILSKADPERSAEIIKKSLTKEEIEEVIQDSLAPEEMARVLSADMTEEEVTQIVSKNLSEPERAKILAHANEAQTAESLKAAMSPADIEALIENSLSEEEKARIIAESLTPEEIKKLVTEKLSAQAKAEILAKMDPEKIAEILEKSMSPEELEKLVEDSLPTAEKAKVIAKSMTKEKARKLVEKNLSKADKAKILASGDTADVAKQLKESLSAKEVAKLIEESLPEEEKAKLVADAMTEEEIEEVVIKKLSTKERAKLAATGDPKRTAEILKKKMTREEIEEVIQESLSVEEQAKVLAASMPEDEMIRVIKGGLTPEDQASVIARADPAAAAKIVRESGADTDELLKKSLPDSEKAKVLAAVMPEEEVHRAISKGMSDDEKAKLFAQENPEEVAQMLKGDIPEEELKRLVKGSMSSEDMAKAIVKGLPDEEVAKILKGAMAEDELAELVKGAIPDEEAAQLVKSTMSPQELVNLISSGASKTDLAKLIMQGAPPQQIANMVLDEFPLDELMDVLSKGLPDVELASIVKSTNNVKYKAKLETAAALVSMGVEGASADRPVIDLSQPPRMKLSQDEARALIDQTLAPAQAVQILTQVLPPPVAEAILFGELPREEIEKTVEKIVGDPAEVKPVTDRLLAMAEQIRKHEKARFEEDQKKAADASAGTQKGLEKKLEDREKSLKFYQNKARELETQLREAERLKQKAIQDAKAAEIKLEKSLADKGDQPKSAERIAGTNDSRIKGVTDKIGMGKEKVSGEGQSVGSGKLTPQNTVIREAAEKTKAGAEVTRISSEGKAEGDGGGWKIKGGAGGQNGETAKPEMRVISASANPQAVTETETTIKEAKPVVESTEAEDEKAETPTPQTKAPAEPAAALDFFKKKSAELERKLRTAEDAQKKLQAQIKVNAQPAKGGDAASKAEALAAEKTQAAEVLSAKVRDLEIKLRQAEKEKTLLQQEKRKGELDAERSSVADANAAEREKGAESVGVKPTAAGGPKPAAGGEKTKVASAPTAAEKETKATQVLQDKVRTLETQLRKLEEEKKQWVTAQKKESLGIGQTKDTAESGDTEQKGPIDKGDAGEKPTEEKGLEFFKNRSEKLQVEVRTLERKYEAALQELRKEQLDKGKTSGTPAPGDAANSGADKAVSMTDIDPELEADSQSLEKSVDSIAKNFEALKADVKDVKLRARIDSAMQEVLTKRAEIDALGKKLVGSIKKKELQFKQTEALLKDEIRRTKDSVTQSMSNSERQKELMVRFQKELEQTRSAATKAVQDMSQHRMKADQAQRQIEELQKEIERLNRRSAMPQKQQMQTSSKEAELAKQLDASNKSVTLKKQEIDVLKKQISDRVNQEAEYKKAIFRLQQELRAAQTKKAS